MSVLASDRTESKFEAITYSIELHDMLIDLMQRSFGVKDLDQLVRVRYAHGKDATEDFSRYRYLMLNYKNRIDQLASIELLTPYILDVIVNPVRIINPNYLR